MATNNFKLSFLPEIKKIIFSKKHEDIKLTCLDWMFYFFRDIPKREFLIINDYGIAHFSSNLLKVQCTLNLLLIGPQEDLIKKLIRLLKNSNNAYAFYRVLNALDSGAILDRFDAATYAIIKEILFTKSDVSKNQKKEISDRLDTLSK